jgi:hypothetical protein
LPWCEDCNRFWKDGVTCPSCGKEVPVSSTRVPWHFKILLAGFAGYMVYRAWWLYELLTRHH